MNKEQFMNLRTKPSILTRVETGWLLGLHEDAVTHLARVRHLPALGKAGKGVPLLFSAEIVSALARDTKWLHRAVVLIREHFKARNARGSSEVTDTNEPQIQT